MKGIWFLLQLLVGRGVIMQAQPVDRDRLSRQRCFREVIVLGEKMDRNRISSEQLGQLALAYEGVSHLHIFPGVIEFCNLRE